MEVVGLDSRVFNNELRLPMRPFKMAQFHDITRFEFIGTFIVVVGKVRKSDYLVVALNQRQ